MINNTLKNWILQNSPTSSQSEVFRFIYFDVYTVFKKLFVIVLEILLENIFRSINYYINKAPGQNFSDGNVKPDCLLATLKQYKF